MYNQSEFGNLETYLLEKKYSKKTSCGQPPDIYIFTGTVGFKKHSFENVSVILINTFNEKILGIISKIFLLLCITGAFVTTINFQNSETADWLYIVGMVASLVPLIISLCIQNVLEYHKDTFCEKCGNKLACEEVGEPVMKETSNFSGYTLTVTRHWKCRYCGNVDTREGSENIFADKGEMLPAVYLKGIECSKCSGLSTVVEFKKPDIKEIGNKRTTRRYYKCTLCGYEDINESEETISRSTHAG